MSERPDREKAAEIVRDAGGQIIGRTRLQKVAYLLELAGFGSGFRFEYHHYGPYSETLFDAIRTAEAFDLVKEEERRANWGGTYSVFTAGDSVGERGDSDRARFAELVAKIDAIELELAATAAYIASVEKCADPWGETARRKPEKAADGRIDRAKNAYRNILKLPANTPLPNIA